MSLAVLTVSLAAAGPNGHEIRVVDGRVSIRADAVALGRLLELLERATGIHSAVPPELASWNVTVALSDLPMVEAVRKIFEGVPLDYAVLENKIVVIAASQGGGGPRPGGSTGPQGAGFSSRRSMSNEPPAQPLPLPTSPISPQPMGAQPDLGRDPNAGNASGQQGGGPAGAGSPGLMAPGGIINTLSNPFGVASLGSDPKLFGNTAPPMFNLNPGAPVVVPVAPGSQPGKKP